MSTLTYRTAGESHGPSLAVYVDGLPAHLPIDVELIDAELKRRQGGYGRGGRQKIETDVVTFLTGIRRHADNVRYTIGSPIVMTIANKDNRLDSPEKTPPLTQPRPGHADLAGSIKWLTTDCRETLERASARENRVARRRRGDHAVAPAGVRHRGRRLRPHRRRGDGEDPTARRRCRDDRIGRRREAPARAARCR